MRDGIDSVARNNVQFHKVNQIFALFPVLFPAATRFFSFLFLSSALVARPSIPFLSPAFFRSHLSLKTLFFFFSDRRASRSGSTALTAFLSPAGSLASACANFA